MDPSRAEPGRAPSKTRTKPETTWRDLPHVGPCTENHNDIVGIQCWPNSLNKCLMKFLPASGKDLFLPPTPKHVMLKRGRSLAHLFIDYTRKNFPQLFYNCTESNSRAGCDFSLGLLLRAWMRGGDEDTVSPCLALHPRHGVTAGPATPPLPSCVHSSGSPYTKIHGRCKHAASSTLA